jgi:osmotically-inducible protein OsmY
MAPLLGSSPGTRRAVATPVKKTDLQLKHDVEQELAWDPRVNAAHVRVAVDGGAVTLLGTVDNLVERSAAEAATKRVAGVRALAQELAVNVLSKHTRSDAEISTGIAQVLEWNVLVPRTITAKVERGVVTLEGEAMWNFQCVAAERAIRPIVGVVMVRNAVKLEGGGAANLPVHDLVKAALVRQALDDARTIAVDAVGGRVTLSGQAGSWRAIDDAVTAAWSAPGVTEVTNLVKHEPVMT